MKNIVMLVLTVVIGGVFLVPDVSGQLIISEFRLRGPGVVPGPNDEFIELYNNSGANHTVAGGGIGYAVVASDGVTRCVVPNGTMIPNRGHYLCVNSVGYSLGMYPAGSGTTATGNATYTIDIPDNAGIAIFNTSLAGNFTLGNRLDAVGSTGEANTLYKEGTGYPSLADTSLINYSFYRDNCGKQGSITTYGPCPSGGNIVDTNNNATDFIFADPDANPTAAGQRLGSPGPENLSSPIGGVGTIIVNLLDSTKVSGNSPNRVRDSTMDPGNNSAFGTVDIRHRFVNNTGGNLTRLRFRIIDLTTFPAPGGFADLRVRSSNNVVVAGVNDAVTCAATGSPATPPCVVSVQGTTLDQPPTQAFGGGFNSTLSAGTVTSATPLAPGASINLRFLVGVQQTGRFRVFVIVESLPAGGNYFEVQGCRVDGPCMNDIPAYNFDSDSKSDISVFRPSTGVWHLLRSLSGYTPVGFGQNGDLIAPADFDGDGRTDVSVFRPSNGTWFRLNSSNGAFSAIQFGTNGDLPLPGDFDRDGRADLSVFRPSNGTWYRLNSSNGAFFATPFGTNGDKPVLGDFDGDGRADLAVFRPSNGTWFRINSSTGAFVANQFGTNGDLPTTGDYDGDLLTDIAVFRPSNGTWYRLNSANGAFVAVQFGQNGDRPVAADFDGDGITDIAVFRPSNGFWFMLRSTAGFQQIPFGLNGDIPTPSAFVY